MSLLREQNPGNSLEELMQNPEENETITLEKLEDEERITLNYPAVKVQDSKIETSLGLYREKETGRITAHIKLGDRVARYKISSDEESYKKQYKEIKRKLKNQEYELLINTDGTLGLVFN